MPDIRVEDNPAALRYEVYVGDSLAGFATYNLRKDTIVFTHTEIDEAYEGQGLGGRLVSEALDDVRRRNLNVVPRCPFVRTFIDEHADYADLVA